MKQFQRIIAVALVILLVCLPMITAYAIEELPDGDQGEHMPAGSELMPSEAELMGTQSIAQFITGYPKVDNPTKSGFTLKFKTIYPLGCEAYYVVLPNGSSAPNGSSIVSAGNKTNLPHNSEVSTNVTGLSSNTNYDVWVVLRYNIIVKWLIGLPTKLEVKTLPNDEARLSNLTFVGGSLAEAFSPDTLTYTATVPYTINSTTVNPTPFDVNASVTVDGHSASAPISLVNAATAIPIRVTAENGTTYREYQLTITRAPDNDAALSNLSISNGLLNPTFNSDTISFSAQLANDISQITVTPTARSANASILVGSEAVVSGSPSSLIDLNVGDNSIQVIVTAGDGITTKTYTINMRRLSNACDVLAVLSPTGGSINGTTITANIPHDPDSALINVTVSPSASWKLYSDPGCTTEIVSNTMDDLDVGENTAYIKVTAEDTTEKIYTLTVNRPASSEASLAALSISSGTLNPVFAAGIKTYTAQVANNVCQITVTPTVSDHNATVRVNNVPVVSGLPSQPIVLSVGNNTIEVKVKAEDQTTICTYTITVRRLSNACEVLSFITPANAYRNGSDWRASIGNDTTTVCLEVAVSPFASWKLYSDPTCMHEITDATMTHLREGENPAYIKVTAEDGTNKIFRVILYRSGPSRSSNNRIQFLVLNGGTLSPAFNPYITGYNVYVPYSTSSVSVTVTTEFARADIRVNGKWMLSGATSAPIALAEGDNTITVQIMAETGSLNTYTISVYREVAQDQVVEIPQTGDSPPVIPIGLELLPLVLFGLSFLIRKRNN